MAAAAQRGTADAPITWLFEPESFAPLAKLVNGERFGIVTDHLGTPTAMFDGEGREVWGAEIDVYGDLRNQRGEREACPFRWPGQYEDGETGLYYNRFRYYDAAIGQYRSSDPIELWGGLRLYSYVRDPLIYIDRLGLAECIPARSRREAREIAQRHAQVRRISKGGEPIPFNELNPSSRGENFGRLQAEGAGDLGRRDPISGAEVFEHPDGHPDQIGEGFPSHHEQPHVHAKDAQGRELIVTYPAGRAQ
jgi:RHS repeat-associated protein